MSGLTLPNLILLGLQSVPADVQYSTRWYRRMFGISLCTLCVLALCLITGNWYRTKYTIHQIVVANASVYSHEDSRTTGIVNYLTGRGPLPESERLPLYRQYVKNVLEKSKMPIPDDFHTRDWDGVNALAITWCREKIPNCPKERHSLQRIINRLFENAIRPPLKNFTPNVHDNLWHLLSQIGAPKVRWLEELDEPASRFVVYSAGDEYSFYDPIDNTIYIRYADSVNNLLDEAGHAKQFRENPLSSYLRMGWSMTSALIGGQFNIAMAQEVYKLRYKKPWTFEGEAHGPIKDKLLEESGLLIVDAKVPTKT